MKKIAILGCTGMLGSMIYKTLKDKYRLILIFREKKLFSQLEKIYGKALHTQKIPFDFQEIYQDYSVGFPKQKVSPKLQILVKNIGTIDAVINCIGIINKFADRNPSLTFFLNSALPHILAEIYQDKLIHATTDCVFDGIVGAPYHENSPHSPTDLYGISKSLGEPHLRSLILRTSLIGPEIADFTSLLEWFRRQEGRTVRGYTNHLWNGLTTKQFASVCRQIISHRNRFPKTGIFHLYSDSVSKYQMLKKFKEKYQVEARIIPVKTFPIDRRLTSLYNLCHDLQIPSFEQMIQDLN